MLTLQNYKNVCLYSKKLLVNKKCSLVRVSNPYLNVIREHPFFLRKYENIFTNKNRQGFILVFFKNVSIIFCKFLFQFFYKECSIPINQENKILAIGHVTNFDVFNKNIDLQYGDFFKKVRKKNIFFFYINQTSHKFNIKKKIKRKCTNYYIFNFKVSFPLFLKFFYLCFKDFLNLLMISAKIKKSSSEKSYIINAALSSFSYSTIQNLIFYAKLKSLIINSSINKIITTFEGHPFEKIVFHIANELSIPSEAYQHSFVSRYQHSMFLDLGSSFRPNKILTSGKNTFDILKCHFSKKTKVELIGSTKSIHLPSVCQNYKSFTCLVIPEGFYDETYYLLSFCVNYLKKYDNVKFILRLHPEIEKNKLIKKYPLLNFHNKNFFFSDSKILDDVKKCNLALYRGSTFAAQAIGFGLKPYYLKRKNEIEIDSLWLFTNRFKEKVLNVNEFYNSLSKLQKQKQSHHLKKAISFSNNFYSKFQYKLVQQ